MRSLIIILCFAFAISTVFAQKPKIGIFDSRGVAIAYYQSQYHQEDLKKLMLEYNEAKDAGDTIKAAKLSDRVAILQMIAHDKGFGKGTVNNILDKFTKELDELAKKENLSCIVSKWEIYSADNDIKFVDVTEKVVAIINPNEKVKIFLEQLKNNPPIEDAFFIED
ncbi:MAG: hypothetical protein V1779_11500 [bacterium]